MVCLLHLTWKCNENESKSHLVFIVNITYIDFANQVISTLLRVWEY